MRAIVITGPGGPEVLEWREAPDPVAAPGEVLVDVAASAVNRADVLQREGRYNPPPGSPLFPGLECSGTIAALTEGVRGWTVGDRVCALLSGGGYAERVAVPAGQLLPVPEGVDLVSAGGLPEVACTVWSNLVMLAGLRAGDVLLVHGGASGIGTMAIQVGKALGATVVCTAGTEAKLARCRELGADAAFSYRTPDIAAAVRDATGGRGADVVLDNMGGSNLGSNITALAVGGRLMVIGMQGGRRGELDLGLLMSRRAAVHATSLRARPLPEKAAIVTAVREHLWPLVAAGSVRPVIDSSYPMARAADAHRRLDSGEHVGKVLLV